MSKQLVQLRSRTVIPYRGLTEHIAVHLEGSTVYQISPRNDDVLAFDLAVFVEKSEAEIKQERINELRKELAELEKEVGNG